MPGQAARIGIVLLHRLAHYALGVGVAAAVLLAVAAWRLSQGPVDLSWLTDRLEAQANANSGPLRLSIGGAALAWEGFRLGVDRPLDLRLTDVRLSSRDGTQHVDVPRAEVSLSLFALMFGRVQPRAVELDNPSLALRRTADGTLRLDPAEPAAEAPAEPSDASLPALLAVLASPPTTDKAMAHHWLGQIRRLRVRDATLATIDQRLGVTWHAARVDIDLDRQLRGGVDGTFNLALAVGDSQARLTGTLTLSPGASETEISARLTPVTPAALARQMPRLAAIAALDAPVGVEAAIRLGPELRLDHAHVTMRASPGTLNVGNATVPLLGATLVLSGGPADLGIDSARVALRGHSGGPITTLTASGAVKSMDHRFDALLSLGLDQVDFADLPALWPTGLGGGARPWITGNITAGMAHDGHVRIGLTGTDDLSKVTVTSAAGTLQGSDLTVHWLRPVPPLRHGQAELRIIDPDSVEIAVTSAEQTLPQDNAALTVRSGSMRIAGLTQQEQVGTIAMDVTGPLANVVALLGQPRLHLLHDHPIRLQDPAGDVTASVSVKLPLDLDVSMDAIAIRTVAHATNVHLGGVVAGRDLSDAALDVTADNAGLTVKGQARLAGIASSITAAMDFRAGPPGEVVQRVTASARPTAAELATAGLDATDLVSGPMQVQAVLTERRDGSGSLQLNADLADAVLSVAPLAWHKPAGAAATATAALKLVHDRLVAIDGIAMDGKDVSLRADAQCDNGRLSLLRVDRLVLGRSDMSGTVRLPATPTQAVPIVVDLSGPQIDLSARFGQHTPEHRKRGPEPPPGPPWTLKARFDRALMANTYLIAPLSVLAYNDGVVFARLSVSGRTGDNAPFSVEIAPQSGVRHLTASAAKAGDLLRALDVINTMQGGKLSVTGTYDDVHPGHTLSGTAEMSDFRIRDAPALGRLLQAMTLYGLVDVLRGPGLAFATLVAPFRLTDGMLELSDARAFSPSLGLTAKGRIDMDEQTADLQGTIVPAYFFNSLLGNVPLVGRLFSPERGGGLFAAQYTLRGNLDDPNVAVNPLAALTPGFLRGVFGIF